MKASFFKSMVDAYKKFLETPKEDIRQRDIMENDKLFKNYLEFCMKESFRRCPMNPESPEFVKTPEFVVLSDGSKLKIEFNYKIYETIELGTSIYLSRAKKLDDKDVILRLHQYFQKDGWNVRLERSWWGGDPVLIMEADFLKTSKQKRSKNETA